MSWEREENPPPESPTVMTTTEMWPGEAERHLLLDAARNLLKAADLMDGPLVIDPVVADELREVRDLNQHWDENMPVFEVRPRPREPKFQSGKDFAGGNPRRGPYCWWAWDNARGPLVSPNASTTEVHKLVADTITAARVTQPEMADAVPDAAPRPWSEPEKPGDWWWPKLD